jgi:hypothetical protein
MNDAQTSMTEHEGEALSPAAPMAGRGEAARIGRGKLPAFEPASCNNFVAKGRKYCNDYNPYDK